MDAEKTGMYERCKALKEEQKEAYAKEEQEAYESQLMYEQWAEEDDMDAPPKKAGNFDGLFIDTRDWLFMNPRNIVQMNLDWKGFHVPVRERSATIKIQISRYISASNWRRV